MRGAAVSIVNYELKLAFAHHIIVNHLRETLQVAIDDKRIFKHFDRTNFININTSEVFTEEEVFELAFSRLINIQTVLIKKLDIDNAFIVRRQADVYTSDCLSVANEVARYRNRHLVDIVYIDAS